MTKKVNQKIRLRIIDEVRNYFLGEMKDNCLVSKKFKKVLNYIKHLFILVSTVTGCVSIFAFDPLVSILTSSLNKSIIKEKPKKA